MGMHFIKTSVGFLNLEKVDMIIFSEGHRLDSLKEGPTARVYVDNREIVFRGPDVWLIRVGLFDLVKLRAA